MKRKNGKSPQSANRQAGDDKRSDEAQGKLQKREASAEQNGEDF